MASQSLVVAGQTVHFVDSRVMADVRSEAVDFIITSPPYWNLKTYGNSKSAIGNSSYESYISDLVSVFSECYSKAKPNAVLVINVNSRRSGGVFCPIAFDIVGAIRDWRFWDHNIWYIPNALPQPSSYIERLLDNKFESLLVFTKNQGSSYKFHKPRVPQKYITADPRAHKKNARGRCVGNILRIPAYRPPNIKKLGYHVAAFPEELVAFFLEAYTDPGDVVLDPFLGSGTTLKVARVMERCGIGYEVHEEYRDLITQRIKEPWKVPDWRDLDIIHSTTSKTGMTKPRKIHYLKNGVNQDSLFDKP